MNVAHQKWCDTQISARSGCQRTVCSKSRCLKGQCCSRDAQEQCPSLHLGLLSFITRDLASALREAASCSGGPEGHGKHDLLQAACAMTPDSAAVVCGRLHDLCLSHFQQYPLLHISLNKSLFIKDRNAAGQSAHYLRADVSTLKERD